MYSRHPLQKKRPPGKKNLETVHTSPLMALTQAASVLDAIDSGVLEPWRGIPDSKPSPFARARLDELGPIGKHLTARQEKILGFRIQTYGDIEARNLLVNKNYGLVHGYLNSEQRTVARSSDLYHDLVAEGCAGLVRAAETFDPSRNLRFSTYAVWWIRARIGRYRLQLMRDDSPASPLDMFVLNSSGRRVRRRMTVVALDEPVRTGEEDYASHGDLLASNDDDPETQAARLVVAKRVRTAIEDYLAALPPDQVNLVRAVIQSRFSGDETLQEVGARFDRSREWVRLVEKKTKEALKKRLRALSP